MRAVLQIGILVSRLLESSRNSRFSIKIGTIPPNSGRLDTLQGFFLGGGVRGHVPPEKIEI